MTTSDGLNQVGNVATHAALSVWSFTGDFLIVILLLATFFLFAWYLGRGPLVAVLLALYGAYAAYVVGFDPAYSGSSFLYLVPTAPALTALICHLAIYALFTIVFAIILRRVVVSDFLYIGIFGLIILSFLGAGFLLALAFHTFPVASVYIFTPAVSALFAPKAFFFWWFVAPAIGLFIFAR